MPLCPQYAWSTIALLEVTSLALHLLAVYLFLHVLIPGKGQTSFLSTDFTRLESPSMQTPPSSTAQVHFSSDVRNMDSWARRTGIPLTTAEALGTTYARAHKWMFSLKAQLIQHHGWQEAEPADPRMLFTIEAPSPWRSPNGLPLSPKLRLQLPTHASSFFSPERRVQWQMVFHSDIFATQRLIVQPITDILNLIQCLLTGVVSLVYEEQLPQGTYTTTRGLPSVQWINTNQTALLEVFGRAHFKQLWKAANDRTTSFKVDFEPRRR